MSLIHKKKLTSFRYCLNGLIAILKYIPLLEYLHIQRIDICNKSMYNMAHCNDYYVNHLKQLIIIQFEPKFEKMKILLKQKHQI
jgi:hypothetical protein